MRIYLVNIVLASLFLASCRDVKVIREIEKVPSETTIVKEEGLSINTLDDYVKKIEEKTDVIVKDREDIATDKLALDTKYNNLASLNLLNVASDVDVAKSKEYYEYREAANQLRAKIAAADIATKVAETSEIATSAKTEERKLTDSIKVRQLVDRVEASSELALSEEKEIDTIARDIEQQAKALRDKIDDAAKNFAALYGSTKALALDNAIAKIPHAKSLEEIEANILRDPQFFSLEAEVAAVPGHGQKFVDLYKGDLPATPPIVKTEINRIVDEAKRQKEAIDDFFNGKNAVPTSQDELDSVARVIDGKLGTTELSDYAVTRGVKRVEVQRRTAVNAIVDPVIPVGGPPIFGLPRPEPAIKKFEIAITAIVTTSALHAAKTKFTSALRGLDNFYDPGKLLALKNAIDGAADSANPRYTASYNNLSDALEPYSVDGLKARLEAAGLVNGSENEVQFYKNFLIIMKSTVNQELFKRLHKKIEQRITDRVNFLKRYIVDHHPTLTTIAAQINVVDAAKTEIEVNNACTALNLALNAHVRRPADCATIQLELVADLAVMSPPTAQNPFPQAAIIDKAKKKIKAPFEAALEKIEQSGSKEEKVKLKIFGKDEEFDIPKGVTDLAKGVTAFNNSYLAPGQAIGLAALPKDHDYSNRILIDEIAQLLKVENIGTAKTPLIYADIMGKYGDELYSKMSAAEITQLGVNVQKTSTHQLAKLHLVLTDAAYANVTSPFTKPPAALLIQNMKDAALGPVADGTPEGAGVYDFKVALQAVYDAIDDAGSASAINRLAPFLRDIAGFPIKANMLSAAVVPGVDMSADFTMTGQLGVLDVLAKNSETYKTLSEVAAIDPARLDQVFIEPKGAPHEGESLVERAGPHTGGKRFAIPASMRRVVFGSDAGSKITIMDQFDQLRDVLKLCLERLKADALAHGAPLAQTPYYVQPMVNAFNLAFAYPLSELLKLKFDGSDDAEIAHVFVMFDEELASRFSRLKSVVLENDISTGLRREIFKLIGGYTDGGGTVHLGVKDRMLSGSGSAETIAIQKHVKNFLK